MKQIQKAYEKLQQKAIRHIISLVKQRLKQNTKLKYFVMKQGDYYFVDIHGQIVWDYQYKKLDSFMETWNDLLSLTWQYTLIHNEHS